MIEIITASEVRMPAESGIHPASEFIFTLYGKILVESVIGNYDWWRHWLCHPLVFGD